MSAPWALLVGRKGTGTSSLAARIAGELIARDVTVGGVVQEAIEENGECTGYAARRVGGAERVVLARRGGPPTGARDEAVSTCCSYLFDGDVFLRTQAWIERAASEADVVVIDEVSKLEVARGGHHDAIRAALLGRAVVLLVVRADQLFSVVERFDLGEPVATLDAEEHAALVPFAEALTRAARARVVS